MLPLGSVHAMSRASLAWDIRALTISDLTRFRGGWLSNGRDARSGGELEIDGYRMLSNVRAAARVAFSQVALLTALMKYSYMPSALMRQAGRRPSSCWQSRGSLSPRILCVGFCREHTVRPELMRRSTPSTSPSPSCGFMAYYAMELCEPRRPDDWANLPSA